MITLTKTLKHLTRMEKNLYRKIEGLEVKIYRNINIVKNNEKLIKAKAEYSIILIAKVSPESLTKFREEYMKVSLDEATTEPKKFIIANASVAMITRLLGDGVK